MVYATVRFFAAAFWNTFARITIPTSVCLGTADAIGKAKRDGVLTRTETFDNVLMGNTPTRIAPRPESLCGKHQQ